MLSDARMAVLIVEDDYFIATDLADGVEDAGCRVVGPAPDVATATDLIAGGEPITLAILDINLADGKSYPVADILVGKGIPFVFMTGQNGEVVPTRFCTVPIYLKPMRTSDVVAEAMVVAATAASQRA